MEGQVFIQRMAKGDASVWDELMPLVKKVTLAAIREYPLQEEDKFEIIQEVMIKVFTKWEQYQSNSKLTTWIYKIARNYSIDFMRQNKVRGRDITTSLTPEDEDGLSITDITADTANSNMDQRLCVQHVLDKLSNQKASRKGEQTMIDVIYWIVENKPSTKELAAFFGSSQSAAKERKSTILKHIRKLCEQHCGHEECAFNKQEYK